MVYNKAHKILLFSLALLFASLNANAQYSSEEELKKAANDYFVEQDYIKALPLGHHSFLQKEIKKTH